MNTKTTTATLKQNVASYHPIELKVKDFSMKFTLEPSVGIYISGELPDVSDFYKACRTTQLPLCVIDTLYVVAYTLHHRNN